MPILWQERMSIGNTHIDDDHKYLICLINSAELALKTQGNRDAIGIIIEQLVRYTEEHFAREEGIQLKVGIPFYAEHKKQHMSLIEQLNAIRKNLQSTESDNDEQKFTQACSDLVKLLRVWLLDHILNTDKRMVPYLKKFPPSFI